MIIDILLIALFVVYTAFVFVIWYEDLKNPTHPFYQFRTIKEVEEMHKKEKEWLEKEIEKQEEEKRLN